MKNLIFFIVLVFFTVSCSTTFKTTIAVKNGSNDTITIVGYQKGVSMNPSDKPNVINGVETINPDSVYTLPKKLKLQKGDALFFYFQTKKNGKLAYSGTHRFEDKEKKYTFPVSQIDTAETYSTDRQIENQLKETGISEIREGDRLKIAVNKSGLANIMDIVPGIAIVDTSAIDDDFVIKNNPLYRTLFKPSELNIIPVPLTISGRTIQKSFEVESNGNLKTNVKFPLSTKIDLGISAKGYYKVHIEAKDAGWINAKAKNYKNIVSSIAHLDSIGDYTTLLDIHLKLSDSSGNYRLFTIEEAFVFKNLTSQSQQYDKTEVKFSGDYASVVTGNAAYLRSNKKDFLDTRSTTIVYLGLTNDKTGVAKTIVKLILEKKAIIDELNSKRDENVVKALDNKMFLMIDKPDKNKLKTKLKEVESELSEILNNGTQQ